MDNTVVYDLEDGGVKAEKKSEDDFVDHQVFVKEDEPKINAVVYDLDGGSVKAEKKSEDDFVDHQVFVKEDEPKINAVVYDLDGGSVKAEKKSEDDFVDHKVFLKEDEAKITIPQKVARFTARRPRACLSVVLVFSVIMSFIAFHFGDFDITADNKGWRSRGTLIANREMQNDVILRMRQKLFEDTDGSAWYDVENTVVRGYVLLEDRDEGINSDGEDQEGESGESRNLRSLQSLFDGCDAKKYYGNILAKSSNLYATYKTEAKSQTPSKSILEPDALFEICEAEAATHATLEENGVCGGCTSSNQCLPPHSLILVLKLHLNLDLDMSCSELKERYTESVQESFTNELVECTQEILENFDPTTRSYGETTKCPILFLPSLVDTEFGVDGNSFLRHSSSYYVTYEIAKEDLYEVRPLYAYTDESIVTAAYDTLSEDQNDIYIDSVLMTDMALALGSLTITVLAMGIHTRSVWLTTIGVLQIILSVPLSYFVYYFIVGLKFFPFLNFIGVFVAAALGADDVFVAVDKWKNARLENPSSSTQDIAAIALPDAAAAMLLTTSTTAVAFFATTICPVTPILCFALFCGLMIMFNYFLNILLVFPALCLYDFWLISGSTNVLINCGCRSKEKNEDLDDAVNMQEAQVEEKESLIHRILSFYYHYLHITRYGLLVAILVATAVCIYIALTIRLPDSVDVRLLPTDHPLERHFEWKQKLLSFTLFYAGGSFGEVTWGVLAADTGVRNDPDSLSTIEIDETFDPTSLDAQEYLLGFCDKLFATDFANPSNADYKCPINHFDDWLRNQTASSSQDQGYVTYCNDANSLPMNEADFSPCFVAWSELADENNVLNNQGVLKILRIRTQMSVNWDASFTVMDKFWKSYEEWMENERANAPEGVNKMFHTAGAFWWYDTNISMLQTAIGAALIAIAFSAGVVLISSRSFSLMLFSGLCVTYVLAATTASLVGFGWDLGFLESICFAILIGISCDFVIHFGHAYIQKSGSVSRFVRTKHALLHMGPSILAAAITTFSAALVMLFCTVTFFTKFALILLMTVVHATVGSFVVYIVFADAFGPAEPTKLIDSIVAKCTSSKGREEKEEGRSAGVIH